MSPLRTVPALSFKGVSGAPPPPGSSLSAAAASRAVLESFREKVTAWGSTAEGEEAGESWPKVSFRMSWPSQK